MIVRHEVMKRTTSSTFCWRSTNKGRFSTDMYGCNIHSFSVWYNFCNAFSSETACGPWRTTLRTPADHSLKNKWKVHLFVYKSTQMSFVRSRWQLIWSRNVPILGQSFITVIPLDPILSWITPKDSSMSTARFYMARGCRPSRPTPKIEDQTMSVVHDCFLNIFIAISVSGGLPIHPQPEGAPCRGDRRQT
jgi:hypothetical protein